MLVYTYYMRSRALKLPLQLIGKGNFKDRLGPNAIPKGNDMRLS